MSTIDSFFQKVIRSFTREIGLQSGFTLELDQQKVLDDVIDLVLQDVGKDKQLTRWLIQFAEDKVESGSNWDFRGDIRNLAREIFQEHYKSFEKDIAAAASQKDFIPKLLGKLKAIVNNYEEDMKGCGLQALKVMEAHGLEIGDFAYGATGVMGYLNKITYKNDYKPGDRALKARKNAENWHTKSSKKKEIIITAVAAGLEECLEKVMVRYENDHQKYESAKQVMRFMYTFGILADITKKLQQYRNENDLMLISDAAVFLKDIIGSNDAPFIYEKIGSTYRHYLIDEFQDTSGFQWENFRPLIQNSLAEGNTNLVVGDVKQSIYRWRGGDWQLLVDKIINDIGKEQTDELNLNQNWRSRKNIIDFNNSLFAGSPSILETLGQSDLKDIANDSLASFLKNETLKISNAYKDVFQEFPHIKSDDAYQGYINISFVASPEEEEVEEEALSTGGWKEEVLKKIPAMVESFQDRGYALKDIAFLVRNKRDGQLIADRLLAYKSLPEAKSGYRYEVISSESLMVGAAVSVNLLLNVLRYFNNPHDLVARVNVVHDYLVYVRKEKNVHYHEFYSEVVNEGGPYKWLPPSFEEVEGKMQGYPLYEVIETLIQTFNLQEISGEYAYLQAFQDIVMEYGKKERADIASFLVWWEEQGYNNAVQLSDDTDAMKILTIHKSKGLQFKMVVIPFCDWRIDHDPVQNNTLWCCADLPPFNEIPYLPLKYSGSLKETIYRESYYEEMIKAYMDSLNLLYVAFTRAEEGLIAFGELPKIDKGGEVRIKRVSDLLFQYLSAEIQATARGAYFKQFWNSDSNTFELGELATKIKELFPAESNIISLQSYPSLSWRNRLSIKPRAKNFFLEQETATVEKINYGLLMHEILAEVIEADDLRKITRQYFFEGLISGEEEEVLYNKLKVVLSHPQVKGWFGPAWEVKTEMPVLPQSGRINRLDRVMIKGNNAIVVDFKSGAVQEKHKIQVRHYAGLLRRMGYSTVEGYIVYLDPVEVVSVE